MLSASFGIAIVTAPFIVGLVVGASGDAIAAWTVMGSLPVLIGLIARRMRGRSGAAWWLLSLVLMSAFYAVSAVYLVDGRKNLIQRSRRRNAVGCIAFADHCGRPSTTSTAKRLN